MQKIGCNSDYVNMSYIGKCATSTPGLILLAGQRRKNWMYRSQHDKKDKLIHLIDEVLSCTEIMNYRQAVRALKMLKTGKNNIDVTVADAWKWLSEDKIKEGAWAASTASNFNQFYKKYVTEFFSIPILSLTHNNIEEPLIVVKKLITGSTFCEFCRLIYQSISYADTILGISSNCVMGDISKCENKS